MKIILLEDVKSLGKKGDVKEVAEGYGRNFLIPKKMAAFATPEAVKNAEALKVEKRQKEVAKLENLRNIAGKLKSQEIILKAKEKDGKLFGSITPKDISVSLGSRGFDISEKAIIIKEAIKKTGQYEIAINLGQGIEAKFNLIVEGEK